MAKKSEIVTRSELATPLDSPTQIESLIHTIRNQQVMLDRDLAMLYGVTTSRLNEQVKRNIARFPESFRFQLTKEECSKSQIATMNTKRGQNIKYLPYAFTEQGIAQLSSVLHSPIAIETSVKIMNAFVMMRRFLVSNAAFFQRLNMLEAHQIETDKRLDEVFRKIDLSLPPTQGIFFDGQIFDAYTFVCDLVREAKKQIVLIDNYVDDSVLTMLDKRTKGVKATIYTKTIPHQLSLDIEKHNAQYEPVEVHQFDKAHDRFLCIDETVYHLGASLKDLGKKWFAFSRMEWTTT